MAFLSSISTYSPSFAASQWKRSTVLSRSQEFFAPIVAILFFLIDRFFPNYSGLLSVTFLAIGFVFPGMAHGSLDYYLLVRSANGKLRNSVVLLYYIGIIGLILGAWFFSPLIVLLVFLLNSAYHFGETDLHHSALKGNVLRLTYGALLILFFFFSHPSETAEYLRPFGIEFPVLSRFTMLLICTGIGAIVTLFFVFAERSRQLINALLVLGIGTQLPLLLAFGIYYILVHSATAWNDLKHGLQLSASTMIKTAAPFTLAGIVFIVAAYALFQRIEPFQGQPVPLVIMGLAAITLPHTISMSVFYRRK